MTFRFMPLIAALTIATAALGQNMPAAAPSATAAVPLPGPAPLIAAQTDMAALQDFRLAVVFSDSEDDPALIEQLRMLAVDPSILADRDVVVVIDTDPQAASDFRKRFRPHGFSLVIADRDGQIIQRKPSPWDLREISRAIDKTPGRRQEKADRRPASW